MEFKTFSYLDFTVKSFVRLDSTNIYIKNNAAFLADKTVIVAAAQDFGRGRLGRSFFSSVSGGGVYLSILFKNHPKDLPPTITAGVCTSIALEEIYGINIGIKWVNDIVLPPENKKAGGILCESMSSNGSLTQIIYGIGINTGNIKFPAEIDDIAVSLYKINNRQIESGIIIEKLLGNIEKLHRENKKTIIELYKKRCVTLGQKVMTDICCGFARDIGSNGELLVECGDGKIIPVHTGEVHVL